MWEARPVARPPLGQEGCKMAAGSIMIPAGQDSDLGLGDFVDQPMFLVDPAGPAPRQVVLQRLGLTRAGEGLALDRFNQLHDPESLLTVLLDPPGEVREGRRIKFQ